MKTAVDARRYLSLLAFALVLACGALLVTGCSKAPEPAGPGEEATQDTDDQAEATPADAQDAATEDDEATDEPIDWPNECLDRHGDITVYAITELTGAQLNMLLEEQDYAWSERNQMWIKIDGSAAFTVCDGEGNLLGKEAIAELGTGATEAGVSYRLITSEYSSVKRAINNLARNVMTMEDVEYLDTSGIAVVSGPSLQRCLVFASRSNDVFTVSVYSEQAVAEGLFNREAGQDVGATIDEAFEALTARTPSAE